MSENYLHNLVKIHGNEKSIVERCVVDAEGAENYQDFVARVKSCLVSRPDDYAEDICALSKEIRLVDQHIGGYRLLHDKSSVPSITDNHDLKGFLLGISHLFFDDFTKKNIILSLHKLEEDFLCSIEYETFNVAIHCFLENAVKYTMPYSKIVVTTDKQMHTLVFDMDSIRIEREEIASILERGVYGRNVPSDLRGQGIGMFLINQALRRSGVTFSMFPDLSRIRESDGIKYSHNTFTMQFPR